MRKDLPYSLVVLIISSCLSLSKSSISSISGYVVDESNNPISGVKVLLTPSDITCLTGEDGTFFFENLTIGSYTLAFSKQGYKTTTQETELRPAVTSNIQVMLSQEPPELFLDKEVIDFDEHETSLSIRITNLGHGDLSWRINENTNWIICFPASGVIQHGETTEVKVSALRTSLEIGSFVETMAVVSNGGSKTIVVKASNRTKDITLNPIVLDFGEYLSTQTIAINNNIDRPVNYSLTTTNAWITLNKTNGCVQAEDSINVMVARAGLSPNAYYGEIRIVTDDREVAIPVTMIVLSNETPIVTILKIANVTMGSVDAYGSIYSVGSSGITRYGFCWSTHENPTLSDESVNLGQTTTTKSFSGTITGLSPETKYYFRAYAENDHGVAYSDQTLIATTQGEPSLPTLSETKAISISASTIIVQTELRSLGNVPTVSEYGHIWGVSKGVTVDNCLGRTSNGPTSNPSAFESTIRGLSASTRYFVRPFAINEMGLGLGDELEVITDAPVLATVETKGASSVSGFSADVGGEIKDTGGERVTECGVYFGKTATSLTKKRAQLIGDTFSVSLVDLEDGVAYYYNAYAVTACGEATGELRSFNTIQKYLPVTTVTISNVDRESAKLSAYIVSDGGDPVTEYGFYYGVKSDSMERITVEDGTGDTFSYTLSKLTEWQHYYVKAFAVNRKGEAVSDLAVFNTTGHPFVDFGLPSNTKWAPDPYASSSGWVSSISWGKNWTLPSKEQCVELENHCTFVFVEKAGVRGFRITGKNGNSIFIPERSDYYVAIWTRNKSGDQCGYYLFTGGGLHYTAKTVKFPIWPVVVFKQ